MPGAVRFGSFGWDSIASINHSGPTKKPVGLRMMNKCLDGLHEEFDGKVTFRHYL